MNQVLSWLAGGDLRSDGVSNQVSELVLKEPQLLDELLEGLGVPDEVVRGRTADALEKIARTRPDLLIDQLPELIRVAESDEVPMVRWHIAMLLGHLSIYPQHEADITETLLSMLKDSSVFVQSWSIVSLCIMAKQYPHECQQIITAISPLLRSHSPAIRTRARKALALLSNETAPFPKGWIKSAHLQELYE